MSEKEAKRRRIASAVVRQAWKLFRRAAIYSWSTVLRLAWAVVRSRIRVYHSKATGVAASNTPRQARLRQLAGYQPEDVFIVLVRQPDNRFDSNAIRIVASIKGDAGFTVGYVKSSLAATLAPMMDAGKQVVAVLERITGVGSKGLHGLNYAYAVI